MTKALEPQKEDKPADTKSVVRLYQMKFQLVDVGQGQQAVVSYIPGERQVRGQSQSQTEQTREQSTEEETRWIKSKSVYSTTTHHHTF